MWWSKSRRALSGYKPGSTQTSFAIEKRAGGHAFQLNFGNGNATTPGQIARAATMTTTGTGLQHVPQVLSEVV